MLFELLLVTAVGVENVGTYQDPASCKADALVWQDQGVPAGCVQKMSPEDAFEKFIGILNHMEKLQQDVFVPPACPEGAECIELE
jgi:hypothetical protein